MKSKEELLKIYSSYLPYDLIVKKKFGRYSPTKDSVLEIDDLKTFSMSKIFRPYLFSMDYLTKEIEHKGKKVILIEFIKMLADDNHFEYIDKFIHSTEDGTLDLIPYWVVEILLEYHFNIFGLSDSEYIKKETLNQ